MKTASNMRFRFTSHTILVAFPLLMTYLLHPTNASDIFDAANMSLKLQEYHSSPVTTGSMYTYFQYAMAALILDYASDPNNYNLDSMAQLTSYKGEVSNAVVAVEFITKLSWADRIYQEAAYLYTGTLSELDDFSYSTNSDTLTSTVTGSSLSSSVAPEYFSMSQSFLILPSIVVLTVCVLLIV